MKDIFNKQLRNTCIDLQREVNELQLENDRLQYEVSKLTKDLYSKKISYDYELINIKEGDIVSYERFDKYEKIEIFCKVKEIYKRLSDNDIYLNVQFLDSNKPSNRMLKLNHIKKVYKMFEVNNNDKI